MLLKTGGLELQIRKTGGYGHKSQSKYRGCNLVPLVWNSLAKETCLAPLLHNFKSYIAGISTILPDLFVFFPWFYYYFVNPHKPCALILVHFYGLSVLFFGKIFVF